MFPDKKKCAVLRGHLFSFVFSAFSINKCASCDQARKWELCEATSFCVHVVFLMVCYLCRCVISCVVSCFDGGRSCRHVVNLKGRRRTDAQLIQVDVNQVGWLRRPCPQRPSRKKLKWGGAEHENVDTEKRNSRKQIKLNVWLGWMATKTTPATATQEETRIWEAEHKKVEHEKKEHN